MELGLDALLFRAHRYDARLAAAGVERIEADAFGKTAEATAHESTLPNAPAIPGKMMVKKAVVPIAA